MNRLSRLSIAGGFITGVTIVALVSSSSQPQSVAVAQSTPQDNTAANFPDTQDH
ncbi:hypothetical protein NC981_23120 [Leptolyngbya sp. DQ-M1]|uniref:hypothetical protein n=1 Tax=Leptolyngbya sp. DQ-M1 TaxID=2933920 RepID=UPI0032969264